MIASPFSALSGDPMVQSICSHPGAFQWLFSDALPPLNLAAFDPQWLVQTHHSFMSPETGQTVVSTESVIATHEVRGGVALATQFEDHRRRRVDSREVCGELLPLTKIVVLLDRPDLQYMFASRDPDGGWGVSTHHASQASVDHEFSHRINVYQISSEGELTAKSSHRYTRQCPFCSLFQPFCDCPLQYKREFLPSMTPRTPTFESFLELMFSIGNFRANVTSVVEVKGEAPVTHSLISSIFATRPTTNAVGIIQSNLRLIECRRPVPLPLFTSCAPPPAAHSSDFATSPFKGGPIGELLGGSDPVTAVPFCAPPPKSFIHGTQLEAADPSKRREGSHRELLDVMLMGCHLMKRNQSLALIVESSVDDSKCGLIPEDYQTLGKSPCITPSASGRVRELSQPLAGSTGRLNAQETKISADQPVSALGNKTNDAGPPDNATQIEDSTGPCVPGRSDTGVVADPEPSQTRGIDPSGPSTKYDLSQFAWNMPCACPVCGKQMSRRFDVERHIEATHAEARSYPCDQCEKKFKLAHHLKSHVKAFHMETKLRACAECGFQTKIKSEFQKHKRLAHCTQ